MAKISADFPTEFHPEMFETAITRHGQYLRWYSSLPCHCMDDMARPDPACRKCLGRGYIYYPAKERRRLELTMSYGGIRLSTLYSIKTIHRIYSPTDPSTDISYSTFLDKHHL